MLKDFLEATNYKISGGSEFQWSCFGENARYLDSDHLPGSDSDYSISAVFDSIDQTVYLIEAWDFINDREYRWINPDFKFGFEDESSTRHIDSRVSADNRTFIDLEVVEDIFEKINAIVAGEEYDTRIQVPITFDDADLLKYLKLAHELDITFNQLVERAIIEALGDYRANPELFKQNAKRFVDGV
jgi:hypothetical protein